MRLREFLVGIEVCLSVVLLIIAGLLIKSLLRLETVDRGFDTDRVLTAEVVLLEIRYPDAESRRHFLVELTAKLEAQPGVASAGIVSVLPLQGQIWTDVVTVEGDTRPIAERPIVPYRPVSAHYLRAMGIPILIGRSIEENDYPRKVALVSERGARQLWPGQNPLGKRFRRGNPDQDPFEVIGVAGDIRGDSLQKTPNPIVYVALWERVPVTASVAVRTMIDPRGAIAALRRTVASVHSEIPVSRVQTMGQIDAGSVAQRRFQMQLVVVFALGALFLAIFGTHSVLAYSVTRRTNDIGIRMALGAKPFQIVSMILRHGLVPVTVGLITGIACALALGRFLASSLFEVRPADPATYAVVAGLMLATAVSACWIPARRVAHIRPLDALRNE